MGFRNVVLFTVLFEKWGCIGIRQDVSEFNNGNQGIALSPLISVQRKLSAKTLSMKELVAKFMDGQTDGTPVPSSNYAYAYAA